MERKKSNSKEFVRETEISTQRIYYILIFIFPLYIKLKIYV